MNDEKVDFNFEKILLGSLNKLDLLGEDEIIKESICLALQKTLNKIKEGELSPSIYPIMLNSDLGLCQDDLAIELSIICAYFHTAADLADDVEDESTNNPVINKYGKAQAINISNKLVFIYQNLILNLQIEEKNKINLLSHFSKCGNIMSSGQFYDIALTNRASFPYSNEALSKNQIIEISNNKAGAELGAFASCLLVALGLPEKKYYDLGFLYGSLAQIFSDSIDIWGKLSSDDLTTLKNTLPIFLACNDKVFGEKTRILLAGKNDSPSKNFMLKRFLSKTQATDVFISYINTSKSAIKVLLESIKEPLPLFSEMINELIDNFAFLNKILLEIREVVEKVDFSEDLGLEKAIKISFDYLTMPNTLENTWEIQRWGFLDEPILIGNVFTPALVLETLLEFEINIDTEIKNLMALKGEKGWCYYSNTNKIPTDSDVLGQLMNLVGRTNTVENYKKLFNEPIEILKQNIDPNGRCATWFDDGLNHNKKEIEETWYGNDCLGVMANAYYGLYLFDKEKYMPLIKNGVAFIINNLPTEKNNYAKGSYYTYYYMFYVVSRLINTLGIKAENLEKLKKQLEIDQLLNGSWNNSSQDTAFALLGLLTFAEVDKLSIKTASKYLADTQNYNGGWSEEDLFICPGKNGTLIYYKNPQVTSAFCLRSLVYANRFLKQTSKKPALQYVV